MSRLHIWRLLRSGVILLAVIAWPAIGVEGPESDGNNNEWNGVVAGRWVDLIG